uniref:Uncharacterized protein n=1 Tax=Rhizophora mucronata TaxID=61149 RepID=A0A2P2Q041_RHIMU
MNSCALLSGQVCLSSNL